MLDAEIVALSAAICRAAIARAARVAVAESLTGGDVVSTLVRTPGASRMLSGAIVAYDTGLKQSLLGVEAELLRRESPVHPEVALAMARGVRRACALDGREADVGVATTGVAGPEPQDGRPVGLVYLAVSDAMGEEVAEHRYAGSRDDIRAAATAGALVLLARRLGVS